MNLGIQKKKKKKKKLVSKLIIVEQPYFIVFTSPYESCIIHVVTLGVG